MNDEVADLVSSPVVPADASPPRQASQDASTAVPPTAPAAEKAPVMSVEEATLALRKLEKVPKPDEKEQNDKVNAISEEMQQLKEKSEALKQRIDAASQSRGGQQDGLQEARDAMKTLRAERDAIRADLNRVSADRAAVKDRMEKLNKGKKELMSELKFTTTGEIDKAVAALERKQQTQSMSLPEEKKLIKELEALKQSKKLVARFAGKEGEIKGIVEEHDSIRKSENEKRAELRAVTEKMTAQHAVLDELNQKREAQGNPIGDMIEERNRVREELNDKYAEMKFMREEFKENNDKFYDYLREQRRLKGAIKKAEWEARNAADGERRRALEEEEMKKIPYEEEMALCDMLVSYLETNFLNHNKEGASLDADKAADSKAAQESISTELDGKVILSRKKDDDGFYLGGAGGKKKKGGKKGGGQKKGKGKVGNGCLVHALDTIESFSMLSLPPPTTLLDVEKSIEQVKAKKTWYSEQPRGAVKSGDASKAQPDENGAGGASDDTQAKAGKQRKGKASPPQMADEALFPSLPGAPPASSAAPEDADDGEAEAQSEGQWGKVV